MEELAAMGGGGDPIDPDAMIDTTMDYMNGDPTNSTDTMDYMNSDPTGMYDDPTGMYDDPTGMYDDPTGMYGDPNMDYMNGGMSVTKSLPGYGYPFVYPASENGVMD